MSVSRLIAAVANNTSQVGGAGDRDDLADASVARRAVAPLSAGRLEGSPFNSSLTGAERRLLLLLVDVALILCIGRVLASLHWGPGSFLTLVAPTVLAWTIVGHFSGIYTLTDVSHVRGSLWVVARTGFIVAASLLLIFYLDPYVLSRSNVLALALATPVATGLWRIIYVQALGAARFQRRVLVVGGEDSCRALLQEVHAHQGHGVHVVGVVDDTLAKRQTVIEGVPVLDGSTPLLSLVTSLGIEEVVLSITQPVDERLIEGIGACYERGILISLMPHLYEEVSGQVPVEHMERGWIGAVPLGRTGGSLYAAEKRLLDIAISAIGLLLAFPVMLVVAALIRLSSPGPVLFRQERIGWHGRPFNVIKFRTMTCDAGRNPFDAADRARVTRIGRWLRRLHLDELPQLFLILRGEMSLVGPRPKRADEARELEQRIPLYRVRYRMRPGLTGWAQVQYGYARDPNDERVKLQYDLYYVRHRSLLLDLTIIVRTAAHVLGMRGL